MEIFGITRQSVHSHLTALVKSGFLIAEGNTRGRTYRLGVNRFHGGIFQLAGLRESDVYFRDFSSVFTDLPKEVESICHYGFTEMLNNAIDHSGGKQVKIAVDRDAKKITIRISDDGEGIFNHIARLTSLQDPREALLELSKGKLTTDPENHTGQGIFFTSRAFDQFAIFSGDLVFTHNDSNARDFLLHSDRNHDGTTVYMNLLIDTSRKLKDVFDEYTGNIDEDFAFNKTVVPVKLALYEGDTLVSRSQAKRIMNRVEKFKTVILDFKGVDTIGQAFADEIFRVFSRRNSQIDIHTVNANEEVKKMIQAAKNYVE
jgi:anti-sigma regulatory factor (Ser/Thr protein kinase)